LNFFHDRKSRELRSQDKNKVVSTILGPYLIENPLSFKVLLMPGLFGPELSILKAKGVPDSNIWALERDPEVFRRFVKMYPHINTTSNPMTASQAIDDISLEERKFDLVYLDFYGVADFEVRRSLQKIFDFKMINSPSLLMVTTGKMRCATFIKKFNDEMLKRTKEKWINSIYIKGLSGLNYCVKKILDYPYYSLNTKAKKRFVYVTTAAYF